GNVVWDCGATHIDNEEDGRNNNRWVGNVLSAGKEEPAEAKVLRDTIAVKRKNRFLLAEVADDRPPDQLIGYTEFRTDLPGGRYVNIWTRRAVVAKADGAGRRVLAAEVTQEKGWGTAVTGWSPDGKTAILARSWESEENGKWEEEHRTFRFSDEHNRSDGYLFDLATGKATNVTGVERVSVRNGAPQYLPGDPPRLRFGATIGGVAKPYIMDLDGKNKRELHKDFPNLVHGMSLSPDRKRGAYEAPAYRLFLADADGSNPREVKTGQRFHLVPTWSPDGAWVLFVAGEHYDCHPHVIKADGTGLKKLASRNGYRGVIDFLDV